MTEYKILERQDLKFLKEILEEAKVKNASDVHITVGIPPKMRVNGKLIALEGYSKSI